METKPKKSITGLVVLLGILVTWLALAGGISFYIEGLWFRSLGYWQVFRTAVSGRVLTFIAAFLLTYLLLRLNTRIAGRRPLGSFWFRAELAGLARKSVQTGLLIGSLAASLLAGITIQAHWLTIYQYWYQVPMGKTDPIFGRDLAFYFFSLPVLKAGVVFLLVLLFFSLVVAVVNYVVSGHLGYREELQFTRAARIHLTVLLSISLLLVSVHFWLERFGILYSGQGVVFGAGYTDLHAWLPCYWILLGLSGVTAILLLASLAARTLRPAILTAAGFGLAVLVLNFYPQLVQTFIVNPNELQKETPYIRNNIKATLSAYNLDEIEVKDFRSHQPLTRPDLLRNQATLKNIRLWDWRPLKDAYAQLQGIRLYYEFEDPDVDRYVIDGQYRQVMLSVRELDFEKIAESAQNWINRHFVYTHGQGLCLSPVNEVTAEGLPNFFIKDIPPRSSVDLKITRPEIYYGERTENPVFVRTKQAEFDYPIGAQNATTTYQADRGLPINSFLMRLLFSWELGIYQILFTDNFTADSRVLLHRTIQSRIPRIAPFLRYDRDPYIVIHQGRLFWIQDAYTVSDRYPYSEPFPDRDAGTFNYIRNSVKVVVDAYSGDVTFYIADSADPIIQVYARIFPGLFQTMDAMDPKLRMHIRYPVDLFDIQREVFGRYHMKDPTVFYNQEDVWQIPTEIYRGNEQLMESYYVIMSLPGRQKEEFILLSPYTPKNKNNMIAWLAARSDGEHYGKLLIYQFPKQELTYGPMQIEARIDQNPGISQLITLWSQKGSRVIRGNLLVIPIEESILYVEPLYLQAEMSEIPELTRIIVVYETQVALGETLDEALYSAVLGSPAPLKPALTSAPATTPSPVESGKLPDLVASALLHYRESQEALRRGDWVAYGKHQKQLGETLEQLKQQGEQ